MNNIKTYLYEDQFSERHDLTTVDKPSKILIIASTPRCGSHMLGHALQKTNSFGFPLEYSNPINLPEWKKRFEKEDFQEVLTEIQKCRTSPNGVFGIKIHYSHIKQYGGFARLQEMFPEAYYVLLTRNDILKQAISLAIARKTGVWISGQKAVNENPEYQFIYIHKCLRELIIYNSSWRQTLRNNGCNYIEMNFDFVLKNIVTSIQQIANFMDVEVNSETIPTEQVTKKQSNNINSEWEKRFLLDYQNYKIVEPTSNNKISLLGKIKGKMERLINV
ncbi:MAG: Stf0 family sulfotransferase [Cyanobacteria bacterium J06635_10]